MTFIADEFPILNLSEWLRLLNKIESIYTQSSVGGEFIYYYFMLRET